MRVMTGPAMAQTGAAPPPGRWRAEMIGAGT